jgi:hypothetical protein
VWATPAKKVLELSYAFYHLCTYSWIFFLYIRSFFVYFSLCILVSAGTRTEDRKWLIRLGMSKLKEL